MESIRELARARLYEFYRCYKYWLDHGAKGEVFSREYGLCSNLLKYKRYQDGGDLGRLAFAIMAEEFNKAHLSPIAPFNGNYRAYEKECSYKMCHMNQYRRQWVEDRLNGVQL